MGYPDKFQGFMINDHNKWTDCKLSKLVDQYTY
jgi:hypothetical protein